jgi:hypothetical protein
VEVCARTKSGKMWELPRESAVMMWELLRESAVMMWELPRESILFLEVGGVGFAADSRGNDVEVRRRCRRARTKSGKLWKSAREQRVVRCGSYRANPYSFWRSEVWKSARESAVMMDINVTAREQRVVSCGSPRESILFLDVGGVGVCA